ncbi:MAG: sulfotransferase [Hyphomicrobiales bacterium]|nr:sulfotransferase [Hyphomicrobiales bacterium]
MPKHNRQQEVAAHLQQAQALLQAGQVVEAAGIYEAILQRTPRHAEAHRQFAMLLQAAGRPDKSLPHLQQAVALQPAQHVYHFQLGNLLLALQSEAAAERAYRQALALRPQDIPTRSNLAISLLEQQKYTEAEAVLNEALKQQPETMQLWHNLGDVYARQGKAAEAEAAYRRAVALQPLSTESWRNLFALKTEMPHDAPEIAQLQSLLQTPSLPESVQTDLHFLLGEVYHKSGQYDRAFPHYQQGNDLMAQRGQYQYAQQEAYVETLCRSTIPSPSVQEEAGYAAPIFIVGMPRSGKTLVEKMLAAHPDVQAGGELRVMKWMIAALPEFTRGQRYPEALAMLDDHAIRKLREQYFTARQDHLGKCSARYITDTLPYNYLYLGLIGVLFPEARVIHVTRDPLDTCLQNYFTRFVQGSHHTYRLEELGRYYCLYHRVVEHWQKIWPGEMVTVDYAALLQVRDTTLEKLLDSLNLEKTKLNKALLPELHTREAGCARPYANQLKDLQNSLP